MIPIAATTIGRGVSLLGRGTDSTAIPAIMLRLRAARHCAFGQRTQQRAECSYHLPDDDDHPSPKKRGGWPPNEVGLARLRQYLNGRNRKHPTSAGGGWGIRAMEAAHGNWQKIESRPGERGPRSARCARHPPAEVGSFRLRPHLNVPNSGKPEFGASRRRDT
jgi:hypothetical protein